MHRYQAYFAEDFVFDADFQHWVRSSDASQNDFWNSFLRENPDKQSEIETARTVLLSVYASGHTAISDEEVREVIAGLMSRVRADKVPAQEEQYGSPEPKLGGLQWWWSAAAVLVLCTIGLWYAVRTHSTVTKVGSPGMGEFLVKENAGNKDQTFRLEDGSTVVLAPGSSLKVPAHFSPDIRLVSLVGKGLFKVAKNAERPFVVYSERLVTRVLGTIFSVTESKAGNETSVEVLEGRVSVYRKQDFDLKTSGTTGLSKGMLLTANQKIVYHREDGLLTRTLAEKPEPVIAAKALPAFVYRNTPVSDVLADIERAYQVDIVFDPEQLTECSVTASFSGMPLLDKIEIICEAIEARFEVLDGQIVIYGNRCQN